MIILEKDNLDRVVLNIIFENSGQLYSKDGVAYFTSSMLSKRGSLNRENTKFSEILDDNAIQLSVSSGRETFTFSIVCLKEKFELALELLKELVQTPNFTDKSFEQTKKEIFAYKKSKENDYDYQAKLLLNKISFDGEMGRDILGDELDNITLDDIKEFFKNLSRDSITILIGGNVDKFDEKEILNLFDSNGVNDTKFYTPKIGFEEQNRVVEQSYIYFLSPFNISKDERYLAKVATHILGSGGFGSRLMEEIRVKNGFAYSAYARNDFTKSKQILSGYMQTKIENQEKAIEILKLELSKFVENGVTEEELISAKQFLIGSEPLRNETMGQRLIKKHSEYYYGLGDGYFQKELKLIESLKLDELNRFIKSHNEINELSIAVVTKK